jgi:hypothetical protein
VEKRRGKKARDCVEVEGKVGGGRECERIYNHVACNLNIEKINFNLFTIQQ